MRWGRASADKQGNVPLPRLTFGSFLMDSDRRLTLDEIHTGHPDRPTHQRHTNKHTGEERDVHTSPQRNDRVGKRGRKTGKTEQRKECVYVCVCVCACVCVFIISHLGAADSICLCSDARHEREEDVDGLARFRNIS